MRIPDDKVVFYLGLLLMVAAAFAGFPWVVLVTAILIVVLG